MSGGSGEQAILMASVAQIACHLGIPASVAAGMTDSKAPDAQAGFEKGITIVLAGHAGAAMVHESAGMHASLMGCSLESYVIDNDMLGNVIRTIRGIGVDEDTLSLEPIASVNLSGPGHYLGNAQTLALMQSEYDYPDLSDRQPISQWEEEGAPTILDRARARTQEVLASHHPKHIAPELDDRIRATFDIRLPKRAVGRS